jgi:type III restriction enzyme
LRNLVGQGDRFSAEAVENGLRFGDYRVDGGVMTATGYNDFLSRLATRIVDAHQRAFVGTNQKYKEVSAFPVYQSYQRLVIGWVNSYIRFRYFGASFEPLENENWRLLLVPGVAEEISSEIGYALVAFQENISLGGAEVVFRSVSEVDSITIRHGSSVELEKCIFQRQPFPSLAGGLERDFMKWVDSDAKVEALLKIHEYKHDFLRRPYLKFDGMPAQYSPDFLVRTDASVYLVETKSQSSLSDINVQRKRKSALNWANSINALDAELRGGRAWSYVLAGEQNLRSYMDNGGSASDYLATTALVENVNEELGALFW